jgi:hypothetical protein
MDDVSDLLGAMFAGGTGSLVDHSRFASVAAIATCTLIAHILLRDTDVERGVTRLPLWLRGAALAVMICSLILAPGDDRAFIYFQF